MEVIRLSLFLYLAAQALSRPTYESTSEYDGEAALDRTVFGVIEAANKNNTLLKEGDIADKLSRSARRCTTCLWKKSKGIVKVPYTIAPYQYSPSAVSLIHDALKEFEVMTCVQFVNRSTESDFLYIKSGAGCWSYIGRTMGQQVLSLANTSCMVYGVIQHEAMHNLGFFHEHTRIDRDNYIDILWENIAKGYKGTFDINDRNTLNLPYDYNSVMQYPKNTYSKSPSLATIVPKPDSTVPIGQRSGLSRLDVRKINALYDCNLCRMKLLNPSGSLHGNSSSVNQRGGNCLWLIQIRTNKILLQFDYMNISSTDYIKVYDGYTQSSPLLLDKTFGFGPLLPMLSSGRNLLIEFVSKSKSTFSQFNATYGTVSGK